MSEQLRNIKLLPMFEVGPYLQEATPLIEKALKKAGILEMVATEDVVYQIALGDMQLWITLWPDGKVAGVAVTEFQKFSKGWQFNHFLTSVKVPNTVDLEYCFKEQVAYAREMKCKRFKCSGRPGWTAFLKAQGFGKPSITMVQDL